MNIALWLITHSTVPLKLLTGFFQAIHGLLDYYLLIHYFCHAKMQLNDTTKSIG